MLTTPQAPWTPNCKQNAPADSLEKPLGRIHLLENESQIVAQLVREVVFTVE